jgi:hypothetical protein
VVIVRRTCALGLAACGLSAAVACTPDFQSASQVTDLRVLAIQQQADGGFADAFADLSTGTVEQVQVTALVVDPQPRGPLISLASLCSPTDTGRCDGPSTIMPDRLFSESPMVQKPVYTLDVPPQTIAQALQSDDLKGFGGIRLQFSLQVDDGDPHDPVMASKILLYTKVPDSMRNHNPEVVSLRITLDGADYAPVGPGGTFSVTPGVEYGLRPVLGTGGAGIEEYDTVDLSGNTIHLREEPRYSFFATTGVDLDRDGADEPLPGQPEPVNGLARFTASAGCGSIWVVVRDGRGGIGWIGARCTAP